MPFENTAATLENTAAKSQEERRIQLSLDERETLFLMNKAKLARDLLHWLVA